jgi:probable phosphoglycerate mutase
VGRLWLVRHGESEGNARGRFTENDSVPLTAAGREQAQRTAAFLRPLVRAPRLVSSPFARALQTAEILAAQLDCAIELEHELREQSLGRLHGQPYEAALATPGYDAQPRWAWRPPEGETLVEVQARAARALAALARVSVGSDVLVVSHAGTIQSCWAHVDGSWEACPTPNCAVVRVAHDGVEFGEPELVLATP